jgi:hypothetical protein
MVEPMSDERLDHLEAESKRRAFGLTERQTAEVDRLTALVGTVCPACKSEILQRVDGEVFCWDVYCGQQLDAYRAAAR